MARGKRAKIGPADAEFVLDDYILYNLVRATSTYTQEMSKVLKSFGLNTTKWRILMLLHDRSPSSVGEIARRSVTKLPTLTRMLIRMEEDGLIFRRALKDDRRIVNVTMTPKAIKTLRMVRSIGQKVFDRAIEGISADEIAETTQTLQRIRANLERSPYETFKECSNEGGARTRTTMRINRAS